MRVCLKSLHSWHGDFLPLSTGINPSMHIMQEMVYGLRWIYYWMKRRPWKFLTISQRRCSIAARDCLRLIERLLRAITRLGDRRDMLLRILNRGVGHEENVEPSSIHPLVIRKGQALSATEPCILSVGHELQGQEIYRRL
jgi:hypothetical protein